MSLLGRLLGQEERDLENPSGAFLDTLGGAATYAGKSVTIESSMQLVPVFSAVSLLAGSIGSLPVMVYRRLEEGRERATNHRAWKLLHDSPNPEMAADEVWEIVGTHLLLWGNAFLAKVRSNQGIVSELWPLRPNRVQVGKDKNGERYFTLDGRPERYTQEDILHIRGLGTDGVVGLSPVQQARQALASSMSLEEFAARFWDNSASPGGVLRHPNRLSDPAAERLRETWTGRQAGVKNAGKTAILEEGMEWQSIGIPQNDAQFIETAGFNNLQVALLFRVPPSMLGAKTGDSLTYSSTEMQGIDFVRWSLRRWLVRIENALFHDPSIFVQGDRFYPEFLLDGLLRADTKTRYESYQIALDPNTGWMVPSEVRDLENLNPLPAEGGTTGEDD